SAADQTVPANHRGKYMAFTYDGEGGNQLSDGMAHLRALATATAGDGSGAQQGITHVHLLPVFDIATIDEDADARIDIDDASSLDALCQALDDIVPAVTCAEAGDSTIRAALETMLEASGMGDGTRGDTEDIQAVV